MKVKRESFYLQFVILVIIGITIFSCQKENEGPVDDALLPYIERFIFEASQRDYPINIDSLGIEVKFQNIANNAVLGRCVSDTQGNSVAIHIDPIYWKRSTELEKEYVMFHELGHCILDRDHTSVADVAGICVSIMEPGTGENCTSNYNEFTRSLLLDELFN